MLWIKLKYGQGAEFAETLANDPENIENQQCSARSVSVLYPDLLLPSNPNRPPIKQALGAYCTQGILNPRYALAL